MNDDLVQGLIIGVACLAAISLFFRLLWVGVELFARGYGYALICAGLAYWAYSERWPIMAGISAVICVAFLYHAITDPNKEDL